MELVLRTRSLLVGFIALLVLALGCGGAPRPTQTGTVAGDGGPGATAAAAPAAPPAGSDLAGLAGTYEFVGADLELNRCPAALEVGVTAIVVTADPPVLHTEGEGRDYEARFEDGALVGEARFPSQIAGGGACPDSTIFERWRLTSQPDGSLAGVHEAVWLFPPDCSSPCQVRFRVRTGPRGVVGLRDSI